MQNEIGEYESCKWVHSGLEFKADFVRTCCHIDWYEKDVSNFNIIKEFNGSSIDWDLVFDKKKLLIKHQKESGQFKCCQKCFESSKTEWDDANKIRYILLNHWSKCNSNCIYCITKNGRRYNEKQPYKLMPIFEDMLKKQIIVPSENMIIDFGGGDVSLLEEFSEIIEWILQNGIRYVIVNTSSIKKTPSLIKGLQSGNFFVKISLDSGTKNIYQKIKRVDKFENVIENIKTYYEVLPHDKKEHLRIKYIIIPGLNDFIGEVDEFLKIMSRIGIKAIILDMESHYCNKNTEGFSPHLEMFYDYFLQQAKLLKIRVDLYKKPNFKERILIKKNSWLFKFKLIFKIYFSLQKAKYTKNNINYEELEW